jgi:hypothetical protein
MAGVKRKILFLCGAVVLAGCDSGGGGAGAGGQPAGTGGSGGSAGSGGSGGTGGNPGRTVSLTMGPFMVASGIDVYRCQNFKNPFGGGDVEVASFESHMTAGSHHAFLFFQPNAQDGAIEPCSGLEFHPTPYSTQRPDSQITYPAGVAALLPAAQGFRIQAHYLNLSGHDIMATVTMTMHLAEPGTVHDHAGVLFFNYADLNIPPGVSTQTKTCAIAPAINILFGQSHMHRHGTQFTAAVGTGPAIYQTVDWSDPPLGSFQPPMALPAGSQLRWSCTYNNDTGVNLTFGESALTNEMCIFGGQYYPVPAGAPDAVLGCLF